MLHTEMIPAWMMAALAFLAVFGIVLALRSTLRRSDARAARTARRRHNRAHRRAWDWVMGRSRQPRLTDQRRED
jgi:CHASE1-domain containing sensor protein